MVAIASRLLTAVRLNVYPVGSLTQDYGNAINATVVIKGRNTGQLRNQTDSPTPAITDVDDNLWAAWKAQNPASDLLTGGWLFEA